MSSLEVALFPPAVGGHRQTFVRPIVGPPTKQRALCLVPLLSCASWVSLGPPTRNHYHNLCEYPWLMGDPDAKLQAKPIARRDCDRASCTDCPLHEKRSVMADRTGQCTLIFAGFRCGGYDIDRIWWEGWRAGSCLRHGWCYNCVRYWWLWGGERFLGG